MENLLLMGIDTRPMVNSALKLDYKIFSISYFKTVDFKVPYREKHVLDQESVISCGRFEENYSPEKLLELSKDFLFQNNDGDEIDKIVLTTGINAKNFSVSTYEYLKIILKECKDSNFCPYCQRNLSLSVRRTETVLAEAPPAPFLSCHCAISRSKERH